MTERKRIVGVSIIVAIALIVFVRTITHAFIPAPEDVEVSGPEYAPRAQFTASSAASSSEQQTHNNEPVRISIPAIGVDAAIRKVGVTTKGSMAVPDSYSDVGWYKYGPSPGENGSAVMAGHLDNGFGFPGVFRDLRKLRKGDHIQVSTKDGTELLFVVTEVASYPYRKVPLEKVFTRADGAHLNLVTCTGAWILSKGMYERRLVVYATLHNPL